MTHSAAHLYTAAAYYVIGAVLLVTGLRLFRTHPINRAFLLGPYLTEGGIRLVLAHWWLMLAFGAFILSCALEHHAEWLLSHGSWPSVITPALLDMLGEIEAIISVATAILVLALRIQGWRR